MKKIAVVLCALILFLCAGSLYFALGYVPNNRFTHTGTVIDESGKPIAGATIIFSKQDWDDETVLSDVHGKFLLKTNMSLTQITAEKDGYVFQYDREYVKNPNNFIGTKVE